MKLLVDIGNSAVKWASEEELAAGEVHRSDGGDLQETLIPLWSRMTAPRRVAISSVRSGERLAVLRDWMWRQWGLHPYMAEAREEAFGVVNGYREPARLGVDRWLALIAARARFKGPVLVVDCGSATTLDTMDTGGRHLGGLILPGLGLFRRCLLENTDIPGPGEGRGIDYFATDTATGIDSGAILATVSAVERMTGLLQQRSPEAVICLLTGGDAGRLSGQLAVSHRIEPNLVLQGLAIQAECADKS